MVLSYYLELMGRVHLLSCSMNISLLVMRFAFLQPHCELASLATKLGLMVEHRKLKCSVEILD